MTKKRLNILKLYILLLRHALNVLKDDLIVRLDQFTSEMVMLREEIESLQTMKACLQLRITELEEEAKKAREELIQKSKKTDDEDVSFEWNKVELSTFLLDFWLIFNFK